MWTLSPETWNLNREAEDPAMEDPHSWHRRPVHIFPCHYLRIARYSDILVTDISTGCSAERSFEVTVWSHCVEGDEGCHERRRLSRDTFPESYITRYTGIRRFKFLHAAAELYGTESQSQDQTLVLTLSSSMWKLPEPRKLFPSRSVAVPQRDPNPKFKKKKRTIV